MPNSPAPRSFASANGAETTRIRGITKKRRSFTCYTITATPRRGCIAPASEKKTRTLSSRSSTSKIRRTFTTIPSSSSARVQGTAMPFGGSTLGAKRTSITAASGISKPKRPSTRRSTRQRPRRTALAMSPASPLLEVLAIFRPVDPAKLPRAVLAMCLAAYRRAVPVIRPRAIPPLATSRALRRLRLVLQAMSRAACHRAVRRPVSPPFLADSPASRVDQQAPLFPASYHRMFPRPFPPSARAHRHHRRPARIMW
mmetsp:Transcript_25637/g.56126  ORF Transcript_25637/g.56126 Transcript_25637/m.56126 type:complete len:256 (-) Transcript_25637:650-1417(-)